MSGNEREKRILKDDMLMNVVMEMLSACVEMTVCEMSVRKLR